MDKSKFDNADLAKFASNFTDFTGHSGWQIKINGRTIKLRSGKSLWKEKGHAKSALKEHLKCVSHDPFPDILVKKYFKKEFVPYKEECKFWQNFLAFAEQEGILEFVELK
jgi:hypothetical protein